MEKNIVQATNPMKKMDQDVAQSLLEKAREIKHFIIAAANILRFIDSWIIIESRHVMDQDKVRSVIDYYEEKGILVYLTNKDKIEDAAITAEFKNLFPHRQPDRKRFKRVIGGEEIYLIRSGWLLSFDRSGIATDTPTLDAASNYFRLSEPKRANIAVLVEKYAEFAEEFMFLFKLAIVNAIKENENKRAILKKVIEYINALEEMKQEERQLIEAINSNPNDARALGAYADYLATHGNFKSAADLFTKALEIDPNNVEIRLNRAQMLRAMPNKIAEAGKEFAKIMEIDPNNAKAHAEYAFYLGEKTHDDELAEINYLKAIELEPKDAGHHEDYAFFLTVHKKDHVKAEEHFKKAIELEPEAWGERLNYITFLFWQERSDVEIEQQILKALELNPDGIPVLNYYVIFLEERKKDFDAAEQILKKLVEDHPMDAVLLDEYAGFMQHYRNNLEKAEELSLKAYELGEESGHEKLGLASILVLRGKIDQALDLVKAAIPQIEDALLFEGDRITALLGCHFLNYAFIADDATRMASLKAIKELLAEAKWWKPLTFELEKAIGRGHPQPALLRALNEVVQRKSPPESLDAFEAWRAIR
nr:tetratricopeptide repeat protein [Candidatus Sigynarchaeota archaeon]